MAKIIIGLAAGRTSYFDPVTNTYLTLDNPVTTIEFDETDEEATVKRLEKICHALFGSVPALRLYEGKIPEACIEHWKNKYTKMFKTDMAKLVRNLSSDLVPPSIEPNPAFDRPELVDEKSADVQEVSASSVKAEKVEVKATAVKEKEKKEVKEEAKEEKVKEEKQEEKKKTARKKKSTKTKKEDE